MAHPTASRHTARARAQLEAALARDRAIDALAAWPDVSATDATQLASAAAAALDRALTQRDAALLSQLAARADRAEDLLSHGGPSRENDRWWRLLFGCLRAADRPRAARMWARIRQRTHDASPSLGRAVDAIVAGGAADFAPVLALAPPESDDAAATAPDAPHAVAAAPSPAPAPADPRLGIQPIRPRVDVPAPSSERDAPVALLAAARALPIARLGSLVSQWASGPAKPWARALWAMTADVALLEALEREKGLREGAPREPLALYAKAYPLGVTDGPRQERFEHVLRWVLARVDVQPALAESLSALGRSALGHPEIAERLASALCRTRIAPTEELFELYAALAAARAGGVALWCHAVSAIAALGSPPPERAMTQVSSALPMWLASAHDDLVEGVRRMDSAALQSFLAVAARDLPVEPMTTLIDALWPRANELQRGRLAGAVAELLDRDSLDDGDVPKEILALLRRLISEGRSDHAIRAMFDQLYFESLDGDMRDQLEDALALARAQQGGRDSVTARRFEATLAKLGERSAAYNDRVLSLAISSSRRCSSEEAARWVQLTLTRHATIERVLDIGHSVFQRFPDLGLEQVRSIADRAGSDASRWEQVGAWLKRDGCECKYNQAVAGEFFDAVIGRLDVSGGLFGSSLLLTRVFPEQARRAQEARWERQFAEREAARKAAAATKAAAKRAAATKAAAGKTPDPSGEPTTKKAATKKAATKKAATKKAATKKAATKKAAGNNEPR